MTIATLARYDMAPEDRESVLAALEPALIATADEAACEYVHVYTTADQPGSIYLVEGWLDEAGLEAHRKTTHFVEIIVEQIIPMLVDRDVRVLRSVFGTNVDSTEELKENAL